MSDVHAAPLIHVPERAPVRVGALLQASAALVRRHPVAALSTSLLTLLAPVTATTPRGLSLLGLLHALDVPFVSAIYDIKITMFSLVAGLLGLDATLWMFVGVIAAQVVLGALGQGAAAAVWLRLARGERASLADVGVALRCAIPLVVAHVAAAVCILAGTLAFLVPGIILGVGLQLVAFAVVDQRLGGAAACRRSMILSWPHMATLLGLTLVGGLLNLLGSLAFGVGAIFTHALVFGALAVAYDRMAQQEI